MPKVEFLAQIVLNRFKKMNKEFRPELTGTEFEDHFPIKENEEIELLQKLAPEYPRLVNLILDIREQSLGLTEMDCERMPPNIKAGFSHIEAAIQGIEEVLSQIMDGKKLDPAQCWLTSGKDLHNKIFKDLKVLSPDKAQEYAIEFIYDVLVEQFISRFDLKQATGIYKKRIENLVQIVIEIQDQYMHIHQNIKAKREPNFKELLQAATIAKNGCWGYIFDYIALYGKENEKIALLTSLIEQQKNDSNFIPNWEEIEDKLVVANAEEPEIHLNDEEEEKRAADKIIFNSRREKFLTAKNILIEVQNIIKTATYTSNDKAGKFGLVQIHNLMLEISERNQFAFPNVTSPVIRKAFPSYDYESKNINTVLEGAKQIRTMVAKSKTILNPIIVLQAEALNIINKVSEQKTILKIPLKFFISENKLVAHEKQAELLSKQYKKLHGQFDQSNIYNLYVSLSNAEEQTKKGRTSLADYLFDIQARTLLDSIEQTRRFIDSLAENDPSLKAKLCAAKDQYTIERAVAAFAPAI